ncbi:MAG TPA: hypothetical protein VML19_27330 [Verrucomicrobiae bacterium]|nr:hypothetical protein [Verrucomicrobiae bacterium]
MRTWVIALLAVALPGWGDTQFRARKMTSPGVAAGKGVCDLRLQVDGDVEVSLRGDIVSLRTLSGRESRDDGSECNYPLPDHEMKGFSFETKDARGDVKLTEKPDGRNGFAAVARIRDAAAGYGRYHLRVSWTLGKDAFPPGPGVGVPEGFVWNNAIHYSGRGNGTTVSNGAETQRLLEASVDIDRVGHAIIAFRCDRAAPEIFNGFLMDREGDKMKIDAATEDHRLRGTMWVTVEGTAVRSVEMDGTDGQDHLLVHFEKAKHGGKD